MHLLFFNFHCSLTTGLFLTETFRHFSAGSAEAVPGIFRAHDHPYNTLKAIKHVRELEKFNEYRDYMLSRNN